MSGRSANSTVYVSSVRDREIDVLNFSNGALSLTTRIPVSGNPERMILNAAQTKLFVVAANSDELIIINTATNTVTAQVNASAPAGVLGSGKYIPKGSNPNSVTLSPDEKTAYVTDGGTNAVAVISLTGKNARRYRLDPHWLVSQFGQRQPRWFHSLRGEWQERGNCESGELPLHQ